MSVSKGSRHRPLEPGSRPKPSIEDGQVPDLDLEKRKTVVITLTSAEEKGTDNNCAAEESVYKLNWLCDWVNNGGKLSWSSAKVNHCMLDVGEEDNDAPLPGCEGLKGLQIASWSLLQA